MEYVVIRGVPIFESNYDLAGALQIAYKNPTLRADVLRANFQVKDDGLHTSLYYERLHYPYHKLLIYHFERKATYALNNAEATHRYFQTFTSKDTNCDG
jgi:hypothetical protein